MQNHANSVKTFLNELNAQSPQSDLSRFWQMAQDCEWVKEVLKTSLPEALAEHCQILCITPTRLTIGIEHASFATALRYQQTLLLTRLRLNTRFVCLNAIDIKILLPKKTAEKKPKRTLTMSKHVGEWIKESAAQVTHPGLKAALERLSRRAE